PAFDGKGWYGQTWRDRLLETPQSLIEPQQKRGAEAPGDRCARRGHYRPDRSKADALKPGTDFGFQAQRRKRQRRQGFAFLSRCNRFETETGRGPGCSRCGSQTGTDVEALAPKLRENVLHHFLLAAEEMGAAGYVEKQAVRPVDGDERRVAVAPVRQVFQHATVGLRIGLDDIDARMHGTRIGNPHTGFKAECLG